MRLPLRRRKPLFNMHLRKIKPDDFTATEQVLRVVMGILG